MKLKKYKDYFNKIAVFYNSSSANYWNTITPCAVNEKPSGLGKYYLDFISKADFSGKFDDRGVPLYRYGDSEPFHHPIVICQYALGLFEKYIQSGYKDAELKKRFLNQADWLVSNVDEQNNLKGWFVNYDIPDYKLKAPWFSAMAQGEAISVLTRAHLLTAEKKYLDAADAALDIFTLPVREGGVVNYFKDIPVYEEYPSPYKTVAVLNGFIFSLFGLFDIYLHTKNEKAKELFQQGVDSLKRLIKFYDLGYWSQYYLFDYPKKYPASYTYHLLAAEQLKAMFALTEKEIFKEYSDKWFLQSRKFYNKTRVLFSKILYARKLSWSDTG